MKKQLLHSLINKCKSFSRHLGRSSTSNNYNCSSKSNYFSRDDDDVISSCWEFNHKDHEIVFVGRAKRPYVISSKCLNHPLLNAVIEKDSSLNGDEIMWVKCEVVLFDHLLWMLDDVESEVATDHILQELAEFYAM